VVNRPLTEPAIAGGIGALKIGMDTPQTVSTLGHHQGAERGHRHAALSVPVYG
jgi:hypothetical protein